MQLHCNWHDDREERHHSFLRLQCFFVYEAIDLSEIVRSVLFLLENVILIIYVEHDKKLRQIKPYYYFIQGNDICSSILYRHL